MNFFEFSYFDPKYQGIRIKPVLVYSKGTGKIKAAPCEAAFKISEYFSDYAFPSISFFNPASAGFEPNQIENKAFLKSNPSTNPL